MFSLLVKVRLLSLWNVARYNATRHKLLSAGLVTAGVGMFALVFLGFLVFLELVRIEDETVELIYEIFYFLFLFLLPGPVPFVASTLYHSSDYLLLFPSPVRPGQIVAPKFSDAS